MDHPQPPRPRRWRRRIAKTVLTLLISVAAVATVGRMRPLPGQSLTPAGLTRNTAVHVTMRDGTRIAVDTWLPPTLTHDQRVPVVLRATRYFRAFQPGPLLRVLQGLRLAPQEFPETAALNAAGFAHVLVDVRGTGASSGRRAMELSPQEIDDLVEVLDWTTRQPWANGTIGLMGGSYDGNAAELLAARCHTAVRAGVLEFSPWDLYRQPFRPGGLLNLALLEPWGALIRRMDEESLAEAFGATGWRRWLLALQLAGAKPVDTDPRGIRLAEDRAGHATLNVMEIARALAFRDDATPQGLDLNAMSPAAQAEALGRCGIPLFVLGGWLDANYGAAALQRFQALPNPQTLLMGSWGHGGQGDSDPFRTPRQPPSMPRPEQLREIVRFLQSHLLDRPPEPRREIRYFTLGARAWRTSPQWPPAGLTPSRWFLREDGRLDREAPAAADAADPHEVDFDATTGPTTRWHQLRGAAVYTNLTGLPHRLLTYTSPPLAADLELTGTAVVRLQVTSTAADGAFHAYLQDVAPDGRVTYVTEGLLRAVHRHRTAMTSPASEPPLRRSFRRADAKPLVAGQPAEIEFELLPTSVLLRSGHRIRLALAGADAGNFERVPESGPVHWQVHRDQDHASSLDLPCRELRGL